MKTWYACKNLRLVNALVIQFISFKITSVERINEYITLPTEVLDKGLIQPPEAWPEHGQIVFDNVSFAYDEHLPTILKSLTFTIDSRDKVGIVGRTGSGKSTVIQTIFRMAELSGVVIIDGFNIMDVSLFDLRNKVSIIPVHLVFLGK